MSFGITFGQPRLLWLLAALPVVGWLFALAWRRRLAADAAWAARGLWERLLPAFRARRIPLSIALLVLATGALSLALARPRWGSGIETVERRGVDVVFLLDSSLSMAALDAPPSRLFVAKALIRRLAQAMPGNRVGLVQAEGDGVVLAPLTLDGAVLDLLLDTVDPGSLPVPGTELATGLDAALKLFGRERTSHRALVILSDGEDFGGGLERRIDRLKEAGVVVFAFGIGTKEGSVIPIPGSDGNGGEFKRDAEGNRVVTQLHEEGLRALTHGTGGAYVQVKNAGVELRPVLEPIGRMRKHTLEGQLLATEKERFQWPLALATTALLVHLAVRPFAAGRDAVRNQQKLRLVRKEAVRAR